MAQGRRRVPDPVRGDEEELPAWVAPFWAGLIVTGSVRDAAEEAGVSFETAWAWREAYPLFAAYWDRAVRIHKAVIAGAPMRAALAREELADAVRGWSIPEVIELARREEL